MALIVTAAARGGGSAEGGSTRGTTENSIRDALYARRRRRRRSCGEGYINSLACLFSIIGVMFCCFSACYKPLVDLIVTFKLPISS